MIKCFLRGAGHGAEHLTDESRRGNPAAAETSIARRGPDRRFSTRSDAALNTSQRASLSPSGKRVPWRRDVRHEEERSTSSGPDALVLRLCAEAPQGTTASGQGISWGETVNTGYPGRHEDWVSAVHSLSKSGLRTVLLTRPYLREPGFPVISVLQANTQPTRTWEWGGGARSDSEIREARWHQQAGTSHP